MLYWSLFNCLNTTLKRFGDYKRKFYYYKARQLFQIERELQRIDEEVIKTMFNDVKILRDNRYSQANELHRRWPSSLAVLQPSNLAD